MFETMSDGSRRLYKRIEICGFRTPYGRKQAVTKRRGGARRKKKRAAADDDGGDGYARTRKLKAERERERERASRHTGIPTEAANMVVIASVFNSNMA